MQIKSYINGKWQFGSGKSEEIFNAVTGEKIGEINTEGIDFKGAFDYAREIGGPKLRSMTFHERALMLKNLAKYLMERKEELYKISVSTGATKIDSWIDIDGGFGTLFTYSGKGRRELPNETFLTEGNVEPLSKNGTFVGMHILVPLEGVALHINAFNFPCWGALEKLAPTWLAGMPAILKPSPISSHLAEKLVQLIVESGIVPEGAIQLVSGGDVDLFENLSCQDVVTFTGSASTGQKLKVHPKIIENSVRFNMETDSLNYSILAPDAKPGTEEFDLFVKEVFKEMTSKAGQKCTAIRRSIVPQQFMQNVIDAVSKKLSKVKIGNPDSEEVRMGSLASRSQVKEVKQRIFELSKVAEIVYGVSDEFELIDADKEKGSFVSPVLLKCENPFEKNEVHEIEAFGPVNTIMPYSNLDEAIQIANKGKGSLVGSIFTADDEIAKKITLATASYHGRIMIINKNCAKESTGHGSPLPHLKHGGPGRAGGGEELGGILSVKTYMQRVALQGSPETLSRITNEYVKGANLIEDKIHPFKKYFEELQIGETLITHRRTITETDVVNFAGISGDFFYAHMDEIAAKESIFEKRVAHGYFVLSAAAGLFVNPAPGPVLANYGIDNLRFIKPVYVGDTIHVQLTCRKKTLKEKKENEIHSGVVEWYVEVLNQENESVAVYTILTLVKLKDQ